MTVMVVLVGDEGWDRDTNAAESHSVSMASLLGAADGVTLVLDDDVMVTGTSCTTTGAT